MRTATATYHAPEGDAKSCNFNGVNFNDGEAVEINSDEHPHLMDKLRGNQHFEFDAGSDDGKAGVSNPNKRDFKAGIENARDHDFEADQRAAQARRDGVDDLDKKPVAELRQMAEERGIDHEGKSKSELREALSQ